MLFNESFFAACTTRNLVRNHWENRIVTCWPSRYIPDEPPGDFDYKRQPLLRWHALTGDLSPQSIGRIPDAIASMRVKLAWDELSRPWHLSHQLSIPLRLGGNDMHSYLVQRPDDFTEQELELARLLQPVLSGLSNHLGLARSDQGSLRQGANQELTLREMAVLSLLSRGFTAESLARRLGISPRTVEKHLEHIYRKLDVGDRLMAVQRAYDLGLLVKPDIPMVGSNGS